MDERFLFENLDVYKRSLDFSIAVCRIASHFEPRFFSIRDQFMRAALSIPLNIAEGSGRKTDRDKHNFYRTARSSVFELIPILDVCMRLELLDKATYDRFRKDCVELSKMLSGLMRS